MSYYEEGFLPTLRRNVAFYHNLSPDTLNQTISTEILKHRDKHSADNYGVQLSEVDFVNNT